MLPVGTLFVFAPNLLVRGLGCGLGLLRSSVSILVFYVGVFFYPTAFWNVANTVIFPSLFYLVVRLNPASCRQCSIWTARVGAALFVLARASAPEV